MATRSTDVSLGISVTTTGSEGIEQLKREVDQLAKSGGTAAPQFEALSKELEKLAAQAKAIESFDQITRDIDALSLAEQSAKVQANELALELRAASATATRFRQEQAEVKAALIQSQDALTLARIALTNYKKENKDAGIATSEYRARVKELDADIIALRTTIADQSSVLREVTASAKTASEAEAKLTKEYTESATQANKANIALSDRENAQRATLRTMSDLGIETNKLTQAEFGLVEAISAAKLETDQLVGAQRQAVLAAEQQAAADRKLASDAERAAVANKQLAGAAASTGQAIKDALATVGVKSVDALNDEILHVRESLAFLRTSGTLTGKELEVAMRSAQGRINELEGEIRKATGSTTLMEKANAGLSNALSFVGGATNAVILAVGGMVTAFFKANTEAERLGLALGAVYGDSKTASAQFDFLRATANRAGVSIGEISDGFIRFSASMKGANIPLEQSNALFNALTGAAGTLGLSGDKVNHMLDAMAQIASKGVASMEELRGQLGDSLPGAMSILARGLKITESDMIQLIESGRLLGKDVIPALTDGLQTMQGEVNTMSAAWARFKNDMTGALQAMGDSGLWTAVKNAFIGVGTVISGTTTITAGFVLAVGHLTQAFYQGITAFATSEGWLNKFVQAGIAAENHMQTKFAPALSDLVTNFLGVSEAEKKANAEMLKFNNTGETVGETTRRLVKEIRDHADATVDTGVQTEATALKAKYADLNWQQLNLTLQKSTAANENQILVSEKLVKAKQVEGDNAIEVAKLIGDEVTVRYEAMKASYANVAANEKLYETRKATLVQQIALRDALVDTVAKMGDEDGARTKTLVGLNQYIDRLGAETEQAKQSAESSRQSALAKAIEADSYQDNSKFLDALNAERVQARQAVKDLMEAEALGLATSEQVKDAVDKLTYSEALYRDALKDTIDALKSKADVQKTAADTTNVELDTQEQYLKTMEKVAIANKDETRAANARDGLREVEIKRILAKAAAQYDEAKSAIDIAEATLKQMKVTNEINPAKERELKATIELNKAKIANADATAASADALRAETNAIKDSNNALKGQSPLREMAIADAQRQRQAIEANIKALEDEQALMARIEAQTWARNTAGQIIVAGGELGTRTGVAGFLKGAGVDEERAKAIANEFADAEGNITQQSSGMRKYGKTGDTLSMALLRAAESITFNQDQSFEHTAQQHAAQQQQPQQQQQQQPSQTRTINIKFNGVETPVKVASDADAAALEAVIGKLAAAKGASI